MIVSFKPNRLGVVVIGVVIFTIGIVVFRKRKTLLQNAVKAIDFLKEKTWDIHSDRRIRALHPLIRAKANEFIIRAKQELNISLRVSSGYRSWEEQTALYEQGRSLPGAIVTNAKAGESFHNYGLAIDVVEIVNGQPIWKNPNWEVIGELGEAIGFSWGGRWRKPDKPHFHIAFGKQPRELAQLYTSGNKNGNFVNLKVIS